MGAALALARRGLGRVWPNPAVGCVLVARDSGRSTVIGRGWTQPGGRPHAETEALAHAGDRARGATAYVTLEPCAHHGKTPPCADALIAAGVRRVVAAIEDPDPRVSGRGLAQLREAGLEVSLGAGADEAREINAGFLTRIAHGRPMVALKLATSLDGKIALASGESRWITGNEARRRAHLLRATHDAVLIGTGTALSDDPQLDCRLSGLENRSPLRVVLDRSLRLPPDAKVFDAAAPTWVIHGPGADTGRLRALQRRKNDVEALEVALGSDGRLDLAALFATLAERGLTRLLVEGGGTLAAGLFRAGLVDRLYWFRAGGLIGGDGRPAVDVLGLETLAQMARFRRCDSISAGDDVMEIWTSVA
jgi:diaminohydroxyphosphoribosylaminopyrimidine deaminase / 5-amino-6-(5-phosphoribosylamino)uracil reductase